MSEIEGTRVETLGPAQADPADPASRGGALQRLADLVCKLMDENGPYSLSLSDAASVLAVRLDSRLAADAKATALYRTCPEKRASRVVAVVADAQAEATKANANRFSRAPGSGWGAPQGGSIGAAVLERPHGGGASWSIIKRRPAAGQKPAANIDVRDLPELIRQQWCGKLLKRDQLFHHRSPLAYLAIPAATAAELFDFKPEDGRARLAAVDQPAAPPATVLQLVNPSTSIDGDQAELRKKIEAHKPMQKRGSRWPDRAAMLRELLSQYNDRLALNGAASDVVEEKLGSLWNLTSNSAHTYLTEARKLPAVESPTARAVEQV